jgi:hypothetical protein
MEVSSPWELRCHFDRDDNNVFMHPGGAFPLRIMHLPSLFAPPEMERC